MRRHLEECAACRAEYAELAPVAKPARHGSRPRRSVPRNHSAHEPRPGRCGTGCVRAGRAARRGCARAVRRQVPAGTEPGLEAERRIRPSGTRSTGGRPGRSRRAARRPLRPVAAAADLRGAGGRGVHQRCTRACNRLRWSRIRRRHRDVQRGRRGHRRLRHRAATVPSRLGQLGADHAQGREAGGRLRPVRRWTASGEQGRGQHLVGAPGPRRERHHPGRRLDAWPPPSRRSR
jgi:hypothetical protein